MEHRKSILNLVKSCNKSFFKEKSIFTIHKIRASSQESLGKKRVIDESSRDRLGAASQNYTCICKFKVGCGENFEKKKPQSFLSILMLSDLTIFCIILDWLKLMAGDFSYFHSGHQVKLDKVGSKRKCPIENVGSCTGYQMMGGGGHFPVWWLRSVYQEMAFQLNLQWCSQPRLIKSSLTTMNVYLLVSTREKQERKIASLSRVG